MERCEERRENQIDGFTERGMDMNHPISITRDSGTPIHTLLCGSRNNNNIFFFLNKSGFYRFHLETLSFLKK